MVNPTARNVFPKVDHKMNVKKLLKQVQFHGLNKIEDVKSGWFWIISLLLLLLASSIMVASIVQRFLDHPTTIVRMEKLRTHMDFPSVQVFPEIMFPEHKIDQFLSQIDYPPSVNKSYMKSVIRQMSAFYSPDVEYTLRDLAMIQRLLEFNDMDVYTAAKALTVTCEETLLKCRLFGRIKNCTELFQLVISQYGFCCIFNGRSLRSEIMKYGVHKVIPKIQYYTTFAGFQASLVLAINQSAPLDDVDLTYKWMTIDGGDAYIDATLNGTPLSPGMEMWFGHKKEGFHISQDAIDLDTELRGCRLNKEFLKYFPIHHKRYCQLECEMDYLLRRCRCAMLAHPVPPSVPKCRAHRLACARKALTSFNKDSCPCVHTCDVDTDHVEITSFRLVQHSALMDSFYEDLDFSKTTITRVFVSKRAVKTKSRRAFYSAEDLFGKHHYIYREFNKDKSH